MEIDIPEDQAEAFARALRALNDAGIPYVVAGAFGVHYYSGYWRDTKDMDVCLEPEDVDRALAALRALGFETELRANHWLAKGYLGDYFVDVIFGEGNWLEPVDRLWIERGRPSELFGVPVLMASVEDLIWAKAYVAEMRRFDGSDIVHLIQGLKGELDWPLLIVRFGAHWQLLFTYVNLFQFVYPSDRGFIPDWVMAHFRERLRSQSEEPAETERICRGTLIDRLSFVFDIEKKGYIDPRERIAEERGFDAADVVEDRRWAEGILHGHPVDRKAGDGGE